MIYATTIGIMLAMQVTPDHLEASRVRAKGRVETRAGSKRLPGDPEPGSSLAFPTMGTRMRDFDKLITDYGAEGIRWPHRLNGKVMDDLEPADRQKLVQKQMEWVDAHDGYPNPAMARQYNNPRSKYYVEKRKRMLERLKKNGSIPENRQPR